MIETVFALLMFIDHEIKEHRIQDSLSVCLKHKRVAERSISKNVGKNSGKIVYLKGEVKK